MKLIKVRMGACLLCREAIGRVVDEEEIKQIQPFFVQVGAQGGVIVSSPFRKGGLEIRIRSYVRPNLIVGCSKDTLKRLVRSSRRGCCNYRKILKISSISESPANIGFRVHISAKMQPMDHMSTPVEYCLPPSKTSGARYQRVTTSWV